jgi:hypothetical protein
MRKQRGTNISPDDASVLKLIQRNFLTVLALSANQEVNWAIIVAVSLIAETG